MEIILGRGEGGGLPPVVPQLEPPLHYYIITGWSHSSPNKIPCVFPEFSLCYINFPCVIFSQKLTISQGIKATSLLYYYIQKHTNSFLMCGHIACGNKCT